MALIKAPGYDEAARIAAVCRYDIPDSPDPGIAEGLALPGCPHEGHPEP